MSKTEHQKISKQFRAEVGKDILMIWLITLACLVAYIAGLILLVRIMPRLIKRAVDDALFIGVAAVAIFGAMLAFGAVGVTFAVFTGGLAVRIADGLLLLILGIVTLRTSIQAFRPRYDSYQSASRVSRVAVGSFFLLLTVTAIVVLGLLFVPS
ncbi:MAG TPA: hypothetical protein VGM01_10750 [Ktedonobacteraceae bacterium]